MNQVSIGCHVYPQVVIVMCVDELLFVRVGSTKSIDAKASLGKQILLVFAKRARCPPRHYIYPNFTSSTHPFAPTWIPPRGPNDPLLTFETPSALATLVPFFKWGRATDGPDYFMNTNRVVLRITLSLRIARDRCQIILRGFNIAENNFVRGSNIVK